MLFIRKYFVTDGILYEMKKLCLECCEEREFKIITEKRTHIIHDTEITYEAEVYICLECGMDIPDNELYTKNLQKANIAYKKKNDLLLAEDFCYIRKDLYQITVRTFAKIIGCSPATISRYEKGAIQTPQHEMTFRLLKDPRIMAQYVAKKKSDLDENEYLQLEERLNFLLEALKIETVLKSTDDDVMFPNFDKSFEPSLISYATLEDYFVIRGYEDSIDEDDTLITNKKLQKLSYYAQSWHLAFTDEPLIPNDFEAWRHGPVINESYHKNKHLGANPLPPVDKSINELDLLPYQVKILDWVWNKYHHFDSQYLERLTHTEEPWVNARKGLAPLDGTNRIIKIEEIHKYFKKIYNALNLMRIGS